MLIEDHSYREGEIGAPVLMLSVAGRLEQTAKRPAAGGANRHLSEMLARLHAAQPDMLPYAEADRYPILNAHAGVEYKALTKRTEAPLEDYITPANAERLKWYVADRPVMAFGERARRACAAAGIVPIMVGRHPSSMTRIKNIEVPAPTAKARMAKRYDLSVASMLRSLCS